MVCRILDDVQQELKGLEKQRKIEGFLTNAENAEKLAGLVEDIRDAVMDYQVCGQNNLISPCLIPISDFIATRHLLQELQTHCKPHFLDAEFIC